MTLQPQTQHVEPSAHQRPYNNKPVCTQLAVDVCWYGFRGPDSPPDALSEGISVSSCVSCEMRRVTYELHQHKHCQYLDGHQVSNLRQQNKGWRAEMRIATQRETRSRERVRWKVHLPLSLCPHTSPGTSCRETQLLRLLLSLIDAGNIDSGCALQQVPTFLPCREPWSISLTSLCRGFWGTDSCGLASLSSWFCHEYFVCWCSKPSLGQNCKGKQMRSV